METTVALLTQVAIAIYLSLPSRSMKEGEKRDWTGELMLFAIASAINAGAYRAGQTFQAALLLFLLMPFLFWVVLFVLRQIQRFFGGK